MLAEKMARKASYSGKSIAVYGAIILPWESGCLPADPKRHTSTCRQKENFPMKKPRLFHLALLLVCVLCVKASHAQDDNPFSLPEGARARLGKGAINGWWDPVAYSSDGTRLAVASDLGIWLYDAHTGTELALLTDHTTRISSVAFAPDGKTIASTSFDETIQLWDVDSRILKNRLEGHTDRVTSVAFAPDGKILASASEDQTVRLWDADSGNLQNTLQGHMGIVSSVAFSPDGKTLASASEDGTVLLWDMSPDSAPAEPTAVQSSSTMQPTQTALLANFPNPFNPDTYIPYQLHAPSQVRLSIYDIRGALIREIDLGYRTAGQYLTSTNAAHWDGRDQRGQRVASGVYLYRLQAGPVAHVRTMVLVK